MLANPIPIAPFILDQASVEWRDRKRVVNCTRVRVYFVLETTTLRATSAVPREEERSGGAADLINQPSIAPKQLLVDTAPADQHRSLGSRQREGQIRSRSEERQG